MARPDRINITNTYRLLHYYRGAARRSEPLDLAGSTRARYSPLKLTVTFRRVGLAG